MDSILSYYIRIHKTQATHPLKPFPQLHDFPAVRLHIHTFHLVYAVLNAGHEHIGGTAALHHMDITVNPLLVRITPSVRPVVPDVQKGCLGQAWHGLMHTLDDNIRAQVQGGHREHFPITEMCAVSLVHNQRKPCPVDHLGNSLNIRHHTVIRGGHDKHCLGIHVSFQHHIHIRRQNPALYPQTVYLLWINIGGLKPVQTDSMIHGLVAVPADQDTPAPGHCPAHG